MKNNNTKTKAKTAGNYPSVSASIFLHLPLTEGVLRAALKEYAMGEITTAQIENLIAGWLPICTAPTDGTVVLTDKGSCAWVTDHWYSCVPDEHPLMGAEFFPVAPKYWKPYPPLPKS